MKYFNRTCFILLLLTGPLTLSMGQAALPGYLITLKGDTISGSILPVSGIYGPIQIDHFIVEPGKSEKTIMAKEVAQYTITSMAAGRKQVNETYYAKIMPHNAVRVFVKPRQEGKAQLYVLPDPEEIHETKDPNKIVFDSDSAESSKADAYYFSSQDTELLLRLNQDIYEPALKQMLNDCPELTEQIGKKKFRFKNLENIIAFYNESCK